MGSVCARGQKYTTVNKNRLAIGVVGARSGGGFLDSFADAMVTMYGGGAVVAQVKEEQARRQEEQQANWQAALAHDYSSLFDGSVFDGLDKLVNGL